MCCLPGHDIKGVEQFSACGADKIYLIDDPAFANQSEDPYVAELVRLVKTYKPEIVLAGATPSTFVFPRVAAVLKTGLTADCTGLDIDGDKKLLRQTRPPSVVMLWRPLSAPHGGRKCRPSARVFLKRIVTGSTCRANH